MIAIELSPWFLLVCLAVHMVCAAITLSEAVTKGYDPRGFIVLGFVLGVIGVAIAAVAPYQDRLLTPKEAEERRQARIAAEDAALPPAPPTDHLSEAREKLRQLPRDIE